MIISALCAPLFLVVTGVIAILPNSTFDNTAVTGFIGMFSTAFQFFPADVWILALGSITFWITVHIFFGIVRFVLSLIPFVNMG